MHKMKKNQYLLIIPLAGLLTLPACNTAPPAHNGGTAAPAPTAASTSPYLVSLTKNAPNMVSVGDQFTYNLTVAAQGDVAETTVMDTIPAGASYVSSEPAAVQDGSKLTWKLGNLNRGESKAIRVTLKAEKTGELTYCSVVSALPRVCVSTTVGQAQLTISKTGPEMAQLGQNVTYTVTVKNSGNTPARNVVVTDPVPEGFSSATGQKEISVSLGELAPGASKAVPITLRADKRGKLCNKALVASSNAGKAEAEA